MKKDPKVRRIYNLSITLVVVLAFILGIQSAGFLRFLHEHQKLPHWAAGIVSGFSPDLQATPVGFSTRDMRVLDEVLTYISVVYFYQDEIDNSEVIHGAATGAVEALGDRYSRFVPPPDQQVLTEEILGEYAGVGISIIDRPGVLPPHALECEIAAGGDPEDIEFMREFRSTVIVRVFETGPAFEVGLLADDVIICVEGETLRGRPADDAVALIKGPPGTSVSITVYRPETQEELTFEVERRVVIVPSVEDVEMLENGIGYVSLVSFNNHSAEDVIEAIHELSEQGLRGLIFDLRNNTGGTVDAAVGVADIFISDGNMVYYQNNIGEEMAFPSADEGYELGVPLVLLTNGATASASEIVAGAVRDTGVGLLVGETTFGKGVVQNVYPLEDGSGLVLTTGIYLTPDKNEITSDGIIPDIISNLDPDRLRSADPEIDEFLNRMDEINSQYAELREELSEYLSGHDFQRETAIDVITEWLDSGVMPSPEMFEILEVSAPIENPEADEDPTAESND